ncbi:MAG: hypothetical protein KF789_01530 [Bdellovibrionaceae bacterium]|nr:hypothetical protein [Pseudobdellovibrionaceae bacterium]
MEFGSLESWELASYMVTVVGLPLAIGVFILEQRRERQNEEEEIYQRLSDEYAEFSKLLLENADLRLMSESSINNHLNPEQHERKKIVFEILISLFERAFILVYEPNMKPQTQRLWSSWEDYIRQWCRREDFSTNLEELLKGEDPEFVDYVRMIALQEKAANLQTPKS